MAGPTRALLVAADACDAGLVRALAAQGDVPHLAALLADGASVPTRAPAGLFVSGAWLTVATGLRPDRHAYYTWLAQEADGYGFRQTSPLEAGGTPFWDHLEAQGRRSAVLDVPHMVLEPRDAPDGSIRLAEWGCHDRHRGTRSVPPGLADELNVRFGAHYGSATPPGFDQFAPCDYLHRAGDHRTPEENRALLDELRRGQARKAAASLHLLDRGDWDVFVTVLGEAHCAGHQLWHLHDPSHPWHDPAQRAALGDPVADLYRRVDAAIGDHLARVGEDAIIYVLLSHGMAAHHDGTLVLDHLLRRFDRADAPAGSAPDAAAAGWRRGVGRGLSTASPAVLRRRTDRLLAAAARRRMARAPAPDAVGHTAEGPVGDADERAGRRWYQIPNNTVTGAIRVNVIGREVSGTVPAAELRATCDRLAAFLGRVVNLDTGEPAVREVVHVDEVYERRPGVDLPDLLVEWNASAPIERVWSPAVGTVVAPATHWRTGDHTPDGLLLARGPGIRPGALADPVGLEDVAPTLCAAVGVELPDVDGRPIASLVPRPVGVGAGR